MKQTIMVLVAVPAVLLAGGVGLEYTIVAVTCSFSQQGVAVRRRSGTRA